MNFLDRFKEPSSWSGIGVLLSLLAPHIGLASDAVTAIIQAGAAICGAASIVMKEKSV